MSVFSRRKFLSAALASAACGGSEMPIRLPYGPNPFDPRQPQNQVIIPQQKLPPKNVIYTQRSPSTPLHLSGGVLLSAGSNGSVPTAALKNPMGQDMEILEIKFEVYGEYTNYISVFGGSVAVELTMGKIKLTNGSIPVWNFGKSENMTGESQQDQALPTVSGTPTWVSYSWRLPRPLFVPAGAVIAPNFTHTSLVPAPLFARIGYSARTVTARPKKVYVPWVSNWISKSFNPIENVGADVSTELDLVNPNPEVLFLQRFTGRALTINPAGGDDSTEFFTDAFGSRYITLRMVDSYGRPIVSNYTPFRDVFGASTRSWELDNGATLDPEGYYIINVKKEAFSASIAGSSGQLFVGMVGWREMAVGGA